MLDFSEQKVKEVGPAKTIFCHYAYVGIVTTIL